MSEIRAIAAILLKNLSDALLQTASEISKLEGNYQERSPELSQTDDQPVKLVTNYQYSKGQKVLVLFDGASTPTKCNILKRIDSQYLVYPQRSPKITATLVNYSQILGLDPDR